MILRVTWRCGQGGAHRRREETQRGRRGLWVSHSVAGCGLGSGQWGLLELGDTSGKRWGLHGVEVVGH